MPTFDAEISKMPTFFKKYKREKGKTTHCRKLIVKNTHAKKQKGRNYPIYDFAVKTTHVSKNNCRNYPFV